MRVVPALLLDWYHIPIQSDRLLLIQLHCCVSVFGQCQIMESQKYMLPLSWSVLNFDIADLSIKTESQQPSQTTMLSVQSACTLSHSLVRAY